MAKLNVEKLKKSAIDRIEHLKERYEADSREAQGHLNEVEKTWREDVLSQMSRIYLKMSENPQQDIKDYYEATNIEPSWRKFSTYADFMLPSYGYRKYGAFEAAQDKIQMRGFDRKLEEAENLIRALELLDDSQRWVTDAYLRSLKISWTWAV